MRFSIEIPDELLSKNGTETLSPPRDLDIAPLYAASGALSGGGASEVLANTEPSAARAINSDIDSALSAGAAETDGTNPQLPFAAFDGGAAVS